ncbi:MAG: 2-succinyl-5-enolpyruvyl-6-hydroxy-3-cyclohexene-1-carboxylic-acid synthase [Bacteroidales bacterium]|nr:2-succinyl-5-enolpyruvyl-6-hydroxy-3-cyclohexene-1-carboxylic-acid synthase [Bacteroidales bacterium]
METTDKISCNIIVDLLQQHHIYDIVVSPGSRNAPLLIAIARSNKFKKHIVVDERCAAFMALGIATITNKPVVLVCTSGSALLNYAPAISEAYYRRTPLIVISADRPIEWIDQDDSQTIQQYEALNKYVKKNYNIPSECESDKSKWYINRIINDAILSCNSGRKAPVHINLQLDEPLNITKTLEKKPERLISLITPDVQIDKKSVNLFVEKISIKKTIIIVGFNNPDLKLKKALTKIAKLPNVVVMTESISNIGSNLFINNIDRTLSILNNEELKNLKPEIVITIGGALVSRFIKQYIRTYPPKEHWHIGITDSTIDCFKCLTSRIEIDPTKYFTQIAANLSTTISPCDYSVKWHKYARKSEKTHNNYISSIGWSELKAYSMILKNIPSNWNIQLSNGTPIRYHQLFDWTKLNRCDCNRGVSGIDGCTSTAIGASIAYENTTLLISGDLCAQYDIGALAISNIPNRFKMIVICNGGGGIFRFINSTSKLPELEDYFVTKSKLPLKEIALGYKFNYYEAIDESSLKDNLHKFITDDSRPSILAIYADGVLSADILKNYFNL